jgi:hypothetical protein
VSLNSVAFVLVLLAPQRAPRFDRNARGKFNVLQRGLAQSSLSAYSLSHGPLGVTNNGHRAVHSVGGARVRVAQLARLSAWLS